MPIVSATRSLPSAIVFTSAAVEALPTPRPSLTSFATTWFACRPRFSFSFFVCFLLTFFQDMHETELGDSPSVNTASALVQRMCYQNKESLMAGIIVAGWDAHLGGQVYTIPLGGMRVRQPFSIGGSGSTYIYGYCDSAFKPNMTKEEVPISVTNLPLLFLFPFVVPQIRSQFPRSRHGARRLFWRSDSHCGHHQGRRRA